MKLNIIIAIGVGILTYAITMFIETREPGVVKVPVSADITASGDIVPAFSFTDINNETYDIEDFKGKSVILNFWASWCPPCIKEFPLFLKAAAEHKDDLVFIALSSDHERAAMKRFIAKLDLKNADNVYIALDEGTKITNGLFQTYRLPETILIDADQRLRHKLIGANWDYEELSNLLEQLKTE